MSKNSQVEEARKKLSSILKKAELLGVKPHQVFNLASAQKLNTSTTRWPYAIFLVFLFSVVPWFGIHRSVFDLYTDWNNGIHNQHQCAVQVPDTLHRIFRPPVSCTVCLNVSKVDKISEISLVDFEESYAYSGRPVIITDATKNWTALRVFSYDFFRSLYKERVDVLGKQNCQFFPYKTDFRNLAEFLNLTDRITNWAVPWYVGWSNCDVKITEVLRKHYQRPYFLPPDAEAKRLDWIFMGSKGFGAPMHLDNVEYPSWQAQLQGRKKWQLQPAPECFYYCSFLEVVIEPGEINTNRWFHSTEIVSDENSITIGAEFD